MQQILRVMIIIAMCITTYLLLLAWQEDYSDKPSSQKEKISTTQTVDTIPSATASASTGDIPVANNETAVISQPEAKKVEKLIHVSTDMYDIKINPVGGDVVYTALKQHDRTLGSKESFVILENNDQRVYVAQSGLIGKNGIDSNDKRAQYQYASDKYVMPESAKTLSVPLTYEQDGVKITKTYTFTKGKYPIEMSYNIYNPTEKPWQGQIFAQLKRDNSKDPGMEDKGPLSMATFIGGAWGTPENDYNKVKFNDFNDGEVNATTDKGWVAVVQHYFVSAWTPNNFTGQFFSKSSNNDNLIGFTSQVFNIPAKTQNTVSATLYAGPKVQSQLKDVAVGLNKSVDYGILWPISKLMFAVLDNLHKHLGNWGWAIIVLTLIVKLLLMWISGKSYYSMAKMRAIAPKMQELKEQHGEDRMKMSQELMALYKKEQVNPMAGCLPILLQMPVFLGLYWVLVESVELRHSPWLLWIEDLSAMDPFFILPIFMGVSMFVQQMLNPQPTDPTQAKVMKIMPIIFTVMMMFFPAGLVLYWTVNNLFSMTQQYYINNKVEKEYKAREAQEQMA